MPRLPGSLSADVYDGLKDYICSEAADKYGVDREQRIEKLRDYDDALRDPRHNNNKSLPTLYTLPNLLSVANISLKDIYKDLWGVELTWPDEQAEEVANIMDGFSGNVYMERFAENLCGLVHTFIEPWWEDGDTGEGRLLNPTERIKNVYMKRVSLDERPNLPEDVQEILKRLVLMFHGVSHLELPRLCEVLHVSMHWVVGYPPEVLVLGKNKYTEMFMDDFLRLSANHRSMFADLVSASPDFVRKSFLDFFKGKEGSEE